MRILITNNTLDQRAGSELYVRDLAIGLLNRGHTPIAYSTRLGEVAKEIRAATIPVIDNLDALAVAPEVIHGHHHLETMTALLRFPGVPAVFFCHGWLPWEEIPPRFPRILKYVAVDQTCRDRLILESGVPTERVGVLLNFVDLERFKPRGLLPPKPRRALVFSNAAAEDTHSPAVREACSRHGITLDVIGSSSGNSCARPEEILGQYDIVFAKGRAALESLAVGAAVVLCDANGVGPLVTSRQLEELRTLNFGLRALRDPVSVDILDRQIARYDAKDALEVSRLVRAGSGRDEIVDQIIAVYREVITENASVMKSRANEEARDAAAYLRFLGSGINFRLAEKERQLQRITNSISWRLLSQCGRIKHNVLLPAYRSLGTLFKSAPRDGSNLAITSRRKQAQSGSERKPAQEVNTQQVFSDIYRRRGWGEHCESVSGPGSSLARTSAFRDGFALLLREMNVRTVLDAGCGDFNWMGQVKLDVDRYIGVDVVSELISMNQMKYENDTTTFRNLDIITDQVSRADLILSRDCLVHLSFKDIFTALRNFKESGSTYLLTTTFTSVEKNIDISSGDWRRLDLQLPPFNFPAPITTIDEKRVEPDGRSSGKYLALWALKDIPV